MIDVATMLHELSEMLHPIHAREGIELNLDIAPGVPPVRGDRGRLQQIVLNLLKNASDATEGQPGRRIILSASREGERVRIRVRDNGCGISKDIIGKIFNPFFTTKSRGKGTGIGLSFVESQIRFMGGKVEVQSKPGDTVFDLSLPVPRKNSTGL
jgi:signal transduction histidine kinase